jgi:hypothetical protein
MVISRERVPMTFLRRLFWGSDRAAKPRQISMSRLPRGWFLVLFALGGWIVLVLLWLFVTFVHAQFG